MKSQSAKSGPAFPRAAADAIAEQIDALAEAVVAREYRQRPELRRFGTRGRARCLEDTQYHLEFLIEALHADSVAQFVDYCGWAKILLHSRSIDMAHLIDNLRHLQLVLKTKLSKRHFAMVDGYLRAGLEALPTLPTDLPSLISPDRPYSEIANSYLQSILLFERKRAAEIVLRAASQGVGVKDIYRHIITPAQHEVGRLWQLGRLTVAHEHYCTAATEIVMAELFQKLVLSSPAREKQVMCFCVEGERHCVGLKMFADLMGLEGWTSTYIGQDTPTASTVSLIAKQKPNLVAVSVTFASNVRSLEALVKELRARAETKAVKVLIGGRATSSALCKRVGADAYAECIGDAVEIANRLLP